MTKPEEFLWIVQTVTLANAINLASVPEWALKYRHVISASGTLILADDAIDASKRIPEEMTAFDAAHEFCTYMLGNLKEDEEKAHGSKMTVPHWFALH